MENFMGDRSATLKMELELKPNIRRENTMEDFVLTMEMVPFGMNLSMSTMRRLNE